MRCFVATLKRDMIMQARNGFYAAAAFVLLCWAALLSQAGGLDLRALLAPLLIGNLMMTGFYFVAGLLLLERDEGSLSALAITPLGAARYLASRALSLALLGLLESLVIAVLFGGPGLTWAPFVAGCLLGATIYTLLGILMIARYDSINAFLMPSVAVSGLLLIPALALLAGWQHPLLALHPLWGPLALLQAAVTPAGPWQLLSALLSATAWSALLGLLASRTLGALWSAAGRAQQRTISRPAPATPASSGTHNRRRRSLVGIMRNLAAADLWGVWRDPLLRWLILLPPGLALAARGLLPELLSRARDLLPIDLLPHYPALMTMCLLLLPATLIGMVVGFLLLDQRDEGTMLALQVSPLPGWAYLAYRIGLPLLVSLPLTLLSVYLAGLGELSLGRLIGAALLAAPLGPLFALTLATLARNKVQGFAIGKAASVFFAAPLVAYFTPPLGDALMLIAPTTWAARYLWEGTPWLLPGGLLYQAALIGLLVRARR